ncbi:Putative DNA-binding domain-containing protein [Pseudomonas sp. NFIX51]|uniref:HvfC/BufC N-terminal domain-containing protein n=1 Tax=unclassified Pseudomonas TaxID=196821 RepID=UPI0008B43AE6|nr:MULTISPECIES: DNA-binding domain-containing protein [unclassified Pseudomonas]SEL94523.1 Putative DNA-binding domain-containing protein [Pseudomonas sp. NFACC41-3]SMH32515.1 Putative DNA-binding domain-containing protein [Pseudomonas sp. NFIX51]
MNTQASFASALFDSEQPCPADLYCGNGADPASRFAVYRNNVQSSLINALADAYPVVAQLVGDEFFRAMATLYVRRFPPTSAVLSDYGHDFADFIGGFPPAAGVPYLADVARLERLRVTAYHAADACPVPLAQLATAMAEPQTLGQLRLELHPSLGLLNSPYPVVDVWAAHQGDGDWQAIDLQQGQSALVLRHDLEVEVFAIDAGSARFIHSLHHSQPLQVAAANALAVDPAFEPSQALALLIGRGAITRLSPHSEV